MSLLFSLFRDAVGLLSPREKEPPEPALKLNWPKTAVTGIGTTLIIFSAIGVLIAGLQSRYGVVAIVLFVLIFVGGLAALVTFVNLHWPPDTDAHRH